MWIADGAVAGVVGIKGGVVSGVINLESPGVEVPGWRPRHEERYHAFDVAQPEAETAVYLFDDWFDPIETCVRDRVREFIQAMIEGELDATLLRPRYGRLAKHAAADKVVPSAVGHRHGRRSRSLTGTFGRVEIEVPRARLEGANGKA